MAGSAVTLTRHKSYGVIRRLVYDCTADDADGSFPSTAIPVIEGGILALETNPGATAPTANYDVALTSGEGADRLAAAGLNRHTTNSEIALLATPAPVSADETLSLAITGNVVNSATTRVVILYTPGA